MNAAMAPAESTAPPPSEKLQAGELLGRYQLLCPIARGGMGQVWAARQSGPLGLPKLVAIKTAIPLESTSYTQVQEFLFDEAQVASSVDHPNVCKILELGHERDVLFIAMEWLNGAPLSTLAGKLPQRRLDFRMAAYLVAQACSGLHAAHELKDDDGTSMEVVHRDATPHNFLITTAGELKVMDFGIVKSKNQQHQATQTGELKGKLSYLAPEQIRGHVIDRRADVFTLGCVLYLITIGKNAFNPSNGQDPAQTILRILEGNYAAPSTAMPEYPAKLEAIVTRALAANANHRFQTAEEMRLALEDFLADGSRAVSRDDVASLLVRHCGPAIEQRRAEIRNVQKAFDSQAGQIRSGTFPAGVSYDASTTSGPSSTSLPVFATERTMTSESGQPAKEALAPERQSPKVGPRQRAAAVFGALALVLVLLALGLTFTRSAPHEGASASVTKAAASPAQPPPAASATASVTVTAAPTATAPEKLDGAQEPSSAPRDRDDAGFRARASRRPNAPRPSTKSSEPALAAPSAPNTEARSGADSSPFSQPVARKPRHVIDETDPFGK